MKEGSKEPVLGVVKAMGGMALLPIFDSSFTCEDYNRAHPWSPFLRRRAQPGPGPHRSDHRASSHNLAPALRGGFGVLPVLTMVSPTNSYVYTADRLKLDWL